MQSLKNLIRYPLDIRRASKLLSRSASIEKPAVSHRTIVLDLHTDHLLKDLGRHIACIVHHACAAQSPVIIRTSRQNLAGIARKPYGRQALSNPVVRWVSETESIPKDSLVLTDRRTGNSAATELMVGCDVVDGSTVMPYPMHPSTLQHLTTDKLAQLRANTERLGILFASNQKAGLTHTDSENNFSVMSRDQLLRTVHDHFGDRIGHSINTHDQTVRITLRSDTRNPVASKNWLPTLSMYDFFICPPGFSQPLSHNAIEAMSVGTIPILEYGGRFHPALTDDENSVSFQGSIGLIKAITRIDAMPPDHITTLRRNVIDYYEKHLRGDRFLQRLRDSSRQVKTVSLPFHGENLYRSVSGKRHRSAA